MVAAFQNPYKCNCSRHQTLEMCHLSIEEETKSDVSTVVSWHEKENIAEVCLVMKWAHLWSTEKNTLVRISFTYIKILSSYKLYYSVKVQYNWASEIKGFILFSVLINYHYVKVWTGRSKPLKWESTFITFKWLFYLWYLVTSIHAYWSIHDCIGKHDPYAVSQADTSEMQT